MDFFEQIGKKLTDAGQSVAQQTKNFSDLAHLNNAISEKERQIAQLYQALGQSYYERHREDPQAEEQQAIGQISSLLAEISQHREAIRRIKGAARCPNCGAQVPQDSAFCNVCGAKMPQMAQTAEETRICPSCHRPIRKENRFCNYCGAKMDVYE